MRDMNLRCRSHMALRIIMALDSGWVVRAVVAFRGTRIMEFGDTRRGVDFSSDMCTRDTASERVCACVGSE